MTIDAFDLVVLGAGPGGYVAAIRAAQLGLRVAVVEQERPGGVCLNWGCIPSKAILRSAELYDEIRREGKEHGLDVDGLHVDYARVVARSRKVVDRLTKGVEALFKKHHVHLVPGHGRLVAPDEIEVAGEDGPARLRAGRILLATGSRERTLPGLEIDGEIVLTSRQALALTRVPESVVVIGGGAVGVEFAYAWASFGARVTIVEMEDRLLPGSELEIAEELRRQFRRRRVTTLLGTRFASLRHDGGRARIEVASGDNRVAELDAERVLVAVGRQPLIDGIGLEQVGVRTARGFVEVDEEMRTSVPSVFAVGDMAGPPLLAHKASAEGVAAAENISRGGGSTVDYRLIPACVYCQPEVASVGLTEDQARSLGVDVSVGMFPFRAIGKSVATGHTEGLVKIVANADGGDLLGCHIIGHGATDLIAEAVLALRLGASAAVLGETVHAHPTLSEALMEAALAAEGRAIHL